MINLKRLPGAVFRFKVEIGVLVAFAFAVAYLTHKWGLVCTSYNVNREMDKLCKLYQTGQAMGNLCTPICAKHEIHSISCISQHSKRKSVFTAKWNKKIIVLKSSYTSERMTTPNRLSSQAAIRNVKIPKPFAIARQSQRNAKRIKNEQEQLPEEDKEKEFERKIRRIASERLNVTLTHAQLEKLRFLSPKNLMGETKRAIEMENVLALLESQEYLLSILFSDRDVFPQILGTCGHFYAVEYLETPTYDSLFALDHKTEWSDRMKLAVAIMDFVEEVETTFSDAGIFFCDVRISNLGVSRSGRVKFLNPDLVYMKNILEKILKSGRRCRQHKDCDHLDCKSKCNLETKVCDGGVSNDNLQMVCEKIFIGWTMSQRMIVPGLLMSEHTPASLSALLRLCADSEREPVHEDLRQKLYTTLTEMHQIMLQKLTSE